MDEKEFIILYLQSSAEVKAQIEKALTELQQHFEPAE